MILIKLQQKQLKKLFMITLRQVLTMIKRSFTLAWKVDKCPISHERDRGGRVPDSPINLLNATLRRL